MGFEFKVYINNGREFFGWQSDTDLNTAKKEVKKDFEISQSLLDLLYLNMNDKFSFFVKLGDEIENLYFKDCEHNVPFIRDCLDKLAKEHIYFEFLRLDWYDRLDKHVKGEHKNVRDAMFYKDITHIPMQIISFQSQIKYMLSKVLDVMSPNKPIQKKLADIYKNKRDMYHADLFDFQPITTSFERIDNKTFTEVLYPDRIKDILDFFLRSIIKQELTFKVCKSCGKYFPATGHGNSEYCNRLFQDTGKTCKEIGSVKVYQKKVEENPEFKAYSRAYKTHFARIKYKRMTKEDFQTWAELARELRDKVAKGEMTLDEYQDWLKK